MCVGGRCVLSGFEQKNPDKLYSIIQIQATIETAVALHGSVVSFTICNNWTFLNWPFLRKHLFRESISVTLGFNFTALERSAILWISWIYTTQPWYILLFLCRDEPECCVLAQYKPLSAVFIYTSYILISIVFLKQAIFTIHYILHKVVEEYVMQYDHRYLKLPLLIN